MSPNPSNSPLFRLETDIDNDEALITFLHSELGDAYHSIVRGLFKDYRVISLDPVRVRIKTFGAKGFYDVGIDPNSARFFYMRAAIKSPRDTFNKTRSQVIKLNAHTDMLNHYHCASQAVAFGWLQLIGYFPSELDRICKKLPHLFRIEHSRPPSPKAFAVTVMQANFDIDFLAKSQMMIVDPYEYSTDEMPHLPKPIAQYPPRVQAIRREQERAIEAETPWDLIPDD